MKEIRKELYRRMNLSEFCCLVSVCPHTSYTLLQKNHYIIDKDDAKVSESSLKLSPKFRNNLQSLQTSSPFSLHYLPQIPRNLSCKNRKSQSPYNTTVVPLPRHKPPATFRRKNRPRCLCLDRIKRASPFQIMYPSIDPKRWAASIIIVITNNAKKFSHSRGNLIVLRSFK